MTPETIGVTVTYKEPITFHLRMIGIDEENQLRQKMFGQTEAEKAGKAYQNNVDMLADLSEAMPTARREVTEKIAVPVAGGEPVEMEAKQATSMKDLPLVEPASTPKACVRAYFRDRTVIKERLAEYAVRAYFMKLQPEISFL